MLSVRKYECGCKITTDNNYPSIDYCPKHKSAPDLYEALVETLDELEHWTYNYTGTTLEHLRKRARKAITKAEGGIT